MEYGNIFAQLHPNFYETSQFPMVQGQANVCLCLNQCKYHLSISKYWVSES